MENNSSVRNHTVSLFGVEVSFTRQSLVENSLPILIGFMTGIWLFVVIKLLLKW